LRSWKFWLGVVVSIVFLALALRGLDSLIEEKTRAAVAALGQPVVDVEAIVARVRAEVAQDLAPISDSLDDLNEKVDEAVAEAVPEPGPAPDQPAPEPEEEKKEDPAPAPEPEASPEPTAQNAEPEHQAPARGHFLHRRLFGGGKAA